MEKILCKITLDYNAIDWKERFELDSDSPSGLKRIKCKLKRFEGKPAGGKSYDLRTGLPHMWRVRYNGKFYAVHRIIWILTYGDLGSEYVIDHIDGNPFNNQLTNLRKVSQEINNRNRRNPTSNTGIMGCSLSSNGQGRYYIVAYVADRNQARFSIDDLGYEVALAKGIEWRNAEIEMLNSNGAGYTEDHGKVKGGSNGY